MPEGEQGSFLGMCYLALSSDLIQGLGLGLAWPVWVQASLLAKEQLPKVFVPFLILVMCIAAEICGVSPSQRLSVSQDVAVAGCWVPGPHVPSHSGLGSWLLPLNPCCLHDPSPDGLAIAWGWWHCAHWEELLQAEVSAWAFSPPCSNMSLLPVLPSVQNPFEVCECHSTATCMRSNLQVTSCICCCLVSVPSLPSIPFL